MSPGSVPNLPQGFKNALDKLYADLDAEVRALNGICNGCGACCRFQAYGHQLWVFDVEARNMLSSAVPSSTPTVEQGCPYQQNDSCTARNSRSVGCRVYFCQLDAAVVEDLGERYTNRLRSLIVEHGLDAAYGEFLDALTQFGDKH